MTTDSDIYVPSEYIHPQLGLYLIPDLCTLICEYVDIFRNVVDLNTLSKSFRHVFYQVSRSYQEFPNFRKCIARLYFYAIRQQNSFPYWILCGRLNRISGANQSYFFVRVEAVAKNRYFDCILHADLLVHPSLPTLINEMLGDDDRMVLFSGMSD